MSETMEAFVKESRPNIRAFTLSAEGLAANQLDDPSNELSKRLSLYKSPLRWTCRFLAWSGVSHSMRRSRKLLRSRFMGGCEHERGARLGWQCAHPY
jgi:hypothetical protein